jgi:Tfp pilus assembly protein PilF
VGYQVQSLVSFDVPPLAVLHVVSAGVLVGLFGRARWKEVELWGRGRADGRRGSRSSQARSQTRRPWANAAAVACVAVLGWCVLLPFRADVEAAGAVPLASAGRLSEAAASFDRAAELNPAEGEYLALEAQSVAGEGRMEDAFALTQQAADREPGSVKYSIFSARLALELGWEDDATRWYREAARRDPFRVDVLNEVARYFIERGDSEQAEPYLRRALVVDPDDEEARSLLTAPTS